MYVCMYVYTHVCMHVCIYADVYIQVCNTLHTGVYMYIKHGNL